MRTQTHSSRTAAGGRPSEARRTGVPPPLIAIVNIGPRTLEWLGSKPELDGYNFSE